MCFFLLSFIPSKEAYLQNICKIFLILKIPYNSRCYFLYSLDHSDSSWLSFCIFPFLCTFQIKLKTFQTKQCMCYSICVVSFFLYSAFHSFIHSIIQTLRIEFLQAPETRASTGNDINKMHKFRDFWELIFSQGKKGGTCNNK